MLSKQIIGLKINIMHKLCNITLAESASRLRNLWKYKLKREIKKIVFFSSYKLSLLVYAALQTPVLHATPLSFLAKNTSNTKNPLTRFCTFSTNFWQNLIIQLKVRENLFSSWWFFVNLKFFIIRENYKILVEIYI